jgi:hypothetical protein
LILVQFISRLKNKEENGKKTGSDDYVKTVNGVLLMAKSSKGTVCALGIN